MSEEPGRERVIAGRYRLLSPLGEGGMGTVWRARDEVLHREVAVKEVRAPAGLPASDVERMYARLEREAWAAARVASRNVVTVYDVATQDGRPWIVMELVRGISLAELLDAEGPITPQRAAHIGAEVLAALRAAHAVGVLHRDVKPANVLLSNDGRVVLTDFGIAMVEGSSALTMTGEVIGSPEFLAPERALGRRPGPESDLWSLGVLLYAAVEGHSPFRQDTPLSTLRAIVDDELPPPRRAGPLTPVIEALLRKDPAERVPAETAERDLRVIGAGGSPRTGAVAGLPYAPTTAAHPERPGPTPPMPLPAPMPVVETGYGEPEEERDRGRRSTVVLIAGLAALALAIGGLTYTLLDRDGGGGGGTAGTGTSSHGAPATTPTPKPTPTPSEEETTPEPTPTPTPSRGTSSPPPQTVHVSVAGAHTDYSGSCPPPRDEAPSFTATFTVGRLPARVDYRWVARDGEVTDSDWKTLSFPEGGGRTRQDRVTVTTYTESGTYENALGVEVRSPVHTTSDAVAFSVTCVEETPTGGASSPAPGATP
ncbi:serine/threonine-protein kinase [Streptomyces griseosporeus]|uniref:serine/threonine-protein kinase n=1 Tax=Streptomyces griseosporeus TaxID=1910 RepID=UPI0037023B3F